MKRDNLLEIAAEDAATDALMSQSPILAANRAATGERTERVGHTRTVVLGGLTRLSLGLTEVRAIAALMRPLPVVNRSVLTRLCRNTPPVVSGER